MGEGQPGVSLHLRGQVSADRPPVTVVDLERWVAHGASWRALELSDERAIVELCTCHGEPVDTLQSSAPELIEFVRWHRDDH